MKWEKIIERHDLYIVIAFTLFCLMLWLRRH